MHHPTLGHLPLPLKITHRSRELQDPKIREQQPRGNNEIR